MKNLRKKLFFIIGGIIITATLIILGYNSYNIRLNEKMNRQVFRHSLMVSMGVIEDAMENVENMLIIDTQKDAALKNIIKRTNSIDLHLALIQKKEEFITELKKYQALDGMFLYDNKNKIYVGEAGEAVPYEMHTAVKEHAEYMIQYFEKGMVGDEWAAVRIDEEYYLVRMIKEKSVYICAWMKPEHLTRNFEEPENEDVRYLLCDQEGENLIPAEDIVKEAPDADYVMIGQAKYNVIRYTSPSRGFSLEMLIKENKNQEIFRYMIVSAALILCMGCLILFAVWMLVKKEILGTFDHMMLKKTLEENKARLQFLQLQINPHFLNNCLSLIRNLVLFEQYDEVENAVLLLSDYTRASFQPDIMITLEKEIEQVSYWYELQKLRMNNRILIDIQTEDEVLEEKIPTMLLHTFAENSVKHFTRRNETIRIRITAGYKRSADGRKCIAIVITDNGAGFQEDILRKLRQGEEITDRTGMKHIGISSIMKRIQILYDGNASVEMRNEESGGAGIYIILPIKGEVKEI